MTAEGIDAQGNRTFAQFAAKYDGITQFWSLERSQRLHFH